MWTGRLRWLQARYTFLLTLFRPYTAGLRVVAAYRTVKCWRRAPLFQPRTYPKVDILNLILTAKRNTATATANHVQAKAGEALLLAAAVGIGGLQRT